MNKGDLVKALEGRLGSRKAAADALEAVLDVIIREVTKGGKVSITGFGTFDRVERAARTGRNPHTGASVRIPKSKAPRFRAGTAFKAVVKKPSTLPKAGPAVGRAAAGTAAAAPAKKTAAKKAAPAKAAPAKKAATKAAPARKTAAKKAAPAKAAPAKKVTAKKAAPAKAAPARKTAAKKAAPAKAAPAKKVTAKKTAAKKAAPAKRAAKK